MHSWDIWRDVFAYHRWEGSSQRSTKHDLASWAVVWRKWGGVEGLFWRQSQHLRTCSYHPSWSRLIWIHIVCLAVIDFTIIKWKLDWIRRFCASRIYSVTVADYCLWKIIMDIYRLGEYYLHDIVVKMSLICWNRVGIEPMLKASV